MTNMTNMTKMTNTTTTNMTKMTTYVITHETWAPGSPKTTTTMEVSGSAAAAKVWSDLAGRLMTEVPDGLMTLMTDESSWRMGWNRPPGDVTAYFDRRQFRVANTWTCHLVTAREA